MEEIVIIKECVGIDISKLDFVCVYAKETTKGDLLYSKSIKFPNNKTGFNQLLKWYRKNSNKSMDVLFLMEATGVYYESLAYHLHRLGKSVIVVLPNKSKHFTKSLNVKTKTDSVDAKVLSQFGIERKQKIWEPPLTILKTLREYTRLLSSLKRQKMALENQNEAYTNSVGVDRFVFKTNTQLVHYFKKQIKKCEEEIIKHIASEKWLKRKIEQLMTIKGVGLLTVAIIVGETQGFSMIENRKQLTSYAGYDVVQKQSGTSLNGRTRISKKGNSNIRAALHMPSFVYIKYNAIVKDNYERINERNTSKMVGVIATQRKLLTLMYTLWKTDQEYIENFEQKKIDITKKEMPIQNECA
jgi:transposase